MEVILEQRSKPIDVVVQGAICPHTLEIIAEWRKCPSVSRIILSTWAYDPTLASAVDEYLISEDPGAYPVIYNNNIIRHENTNRQIISTRKGLESATAPFSIKWRTDFLFCKLKMELFIQESIRLTESYPQDILFALTINSTNPFASPGLVGHVSDWMYLAKTEFLKNLLPSSAIDLNAMNCAVPDTIMFAGAFPIGRFSAEQWMLKDGLEKMFGVTINNFNDKEATLPYLKLIGRSIRLISPEEIGLKSLKYQYLVTPQWRNIKKYMAFRMATISSIESKILGSKYGHIPGIWLLKLKAATLTYWKMLKFFRKFLCRKN
jgi:hypothetical protein